LFLSYHNMSRLWLMCWSSCRSWHACSLAALQQPVLQCSSQDMKPFLTLLAVEGCWRFVLRSADYYPLLFSMDICPALRELLSCANPAVRAKACSVSQQNVSIDCKWYTQTISSELKWIFARVCDLSLWIPVDMSSSR
jgi:hypothetical protein